MNSKTEGTLAIIAAIFVIFVAMISPWVSAILAAVLLAAFGIAMLVVKKS